MTKQFTSDLKLKSVKYYNKIKNYVKVCNIFECSERSLKRWVEKYKTYNHLDRKSRKKGSYKLKKIHIDFITKSLKKENDIQMNTLHNQIKNKFPELNIYQDNIYQI